MLIWLPTTKLHIQCMFYIPAHNWERVKSFRKGLWLLKATLSATHMWIHILPNYKTDLRYFIPSVTKKEEQLGHIFFITKNRQNYPKDTALSKTRYVTNLVLSFCCINFSQTLTTCFLICLKKKVWLMLCGCMWYTFASKSFWCCHYSLLQLLHMTL